ncbi:MULTISPECIES: molecular chaperone DnaJ [Actinomadura]|uniref:Molecular chaperone DnaJ n=1 Tax=Actinomadura litoris TaxID=2678616 RepID=A0A7K1L7G2_9ACTN|nr:MULTISPECIES: molecular chaperone DnaJ [Actinomadura]MBT2209552.1 molecular chaperone DnaJ [Actinomadura sp. NEAU-AAG7]MUN40243.1 molecular chaperone DnaJ [Actinomadura litoris]
MTPRAGELDEALALLDRARVPADLFGDDAAEAARRYRRLARLLHPDATRGRTRAAFIRLTALWRAHTGADASVITTRRHSYRVTGDPVRGDLAQLYAAEPDGARVLLKMPRDPRDGDLLEREAVALRQLPKDGDGRFLPYVPRLVESFRHRDEASGAQRQVNALAALEGFHTLAEVRRAFPGGLDPRDAAWMWRRLLVGLGFAHRAGVLHGAVLPDHVMIHPAEHGLVLVDWCYSVPGCYAGTDPSGRVPAMVDRYADWYPPEVPARGTASPATDIFMATRCVTELMGDRAPKAMRAFARGCLLPAQRRRPSDAWRLLEELDELLERLYGPRRFRPFHLPEQN